MENHNLLEDVLYLLTIPAMITGFILFLLYMCKVRPEDKLNKDIIKKIKR